MSSTTIETLVDQLIVWNEAYRVGNPLVDDAQYDRVRQKLEALEPSHPFLLSVEPEVPRTFGGNIKLPEPMLSMQKAYSWEEIMKWAKEVEAAAGTDSVGLRAVPKLDGFSAIQWNTPEGRLKMATRGDGEEGQDITHFVYRSGQLPGGPLPTPIKGEIVVDKEYFHEHLAHKYKNTRSVIAAAIKVGLPEPEILKAMSAQAIKFVPFSQLDQIGIALADLRTYGPDFLEDAWQLHVTNNWYQCDGVVLEVMARGVAIRMGVGSNHFKWQMAYKRNLNFADAVVTGVEWNTSRHGRIVPTVTIEPTELGGVTISRVTGHNALNVIDQGIDKGAVVSITRAGDVIPYIEKVVSPSEQPKSVVRCPSCGSSSVWNGVDLVCLSVPSSCPAQAGSALEHFFKSLQLDGFGPALCEAIANSARRPNPVEIILRPQEALAGVPGLSLANRVWKELDALKHRWVEDWRILAAFGIPGCGERKSKAILSVYSLEALHTLSESDFESITDVGPKLAKELHAALKLISFSITELCSTLMVKPSWTEKKEGVLTGQVVVFTGTLRSAKREVLAEQAVGLGAEVGKSVTKATTLLVTGENVGENKTAAAKRLGVRVVTEDEYLFMIGEAL